LVIERVRGEICVNIRVENNFSTYGLRVVIVSPPPLVLPSYVIVNPIITTSNHYEIATSGKP